MALNPVADYFNHSATANATAECTDGAYRIRTTASVQKGEEIFISYGRHSNDFLLAEYGFVLDENDWDEVDISDFVEPLFDEMQTRLLKENHFLGNYILDRNGACHRTEITLRLLGMNERRWMRSVNGTEDSQSTQRDVDARLIEVISSLQSTVDHHVKSLGCSQRDTLDQTILIEKRWMQISALLDKIMLRLTEPL